MKFLLTQNKSYAATVRLGFFEGIASNQMIAEKLVSAGFVSVTVSGSGRDRSATGTWIKLDESVDLPDQVTSVTEK